MKRLFIMFLHKVFSLGKAADFIRLRQSHTAIRTISKSPVPFGNDSYYNVYRPPLTVQKHGSLQIVTEAAVSVLFSCNSGTCIFQAYFQSK